MTFFNLSEATARYDQYRPKVHNVIIDWLAQFPSAEPFTRALDVACGTGDSTVPLQKIAQEVVGIDASPEMLFFASNKGLATRQMSYAEIPSLGQFDLITTCMAFHWFDEPQALKAYKKASKNGAYWLIYNFYYAGHSDCAALNRWFEEDYLSLYPSPKRGKHQPLLENLDPDIQHLKRAEGYLEVEFSKERLIKYFTTQSNIEQAVQQGKSYQQVEDDLMQQLSADSYAEAFTKGHFLYGYHYDIYTLVGN